MACFHPPTYLCLFIYIFIIAWGSSFSWHGASGPDMLETRHRCVLGIDPKYCTGPHSTVRTQNMSPCEDWATDWKTRTWVTCFSDLRFILSSQSNVRAYRMKSPIVMLPSGTVYKLRQRKRNKNRLRRLRLMNRGPNAVELTPKWPGKGWEGKSGPIPIPRYIFFSSIQIPFSNKLLGRRRLAFWRSNQPFGLILPCHRRRV